MALVNTNTDKWVINPAQPNQKILVDYVFLIITTITKNQINIEAKFSSDRENPIGDVGQFYIGTIESNIQDPLMAIKIHAHAKLVLGDNFEVVNITL
jgi:hypothetical protein